jgi:hypothetical protein
MSSAEQRGLSTESSFSELNQGSFVRSPQPQTLENNSVIQNSKLKTQNSIKLHIEELVLHGFTGNDRDRIAAAIQQEFTRLFTEQGIPPSLAQGGQIGQLNGGKFEMTTGMKPEVAGIQIAQSIYGGLGE